MRTTPLVSKVIPTENILANPGKPGQFSSLFKDANAIILQDFFSETELNTIINTIYQLKDRWLPNYDGEQFSLGRIWYTHFDEHINRVVPE